MSTSLVTASTIPRAQQIRTFLQQHDLRAWIAWRPDELLMLSGYFPYWGASLLICFADAEPILFVPLLEPRDHIPAGLRVQEYPWGDLKCSDPYSVLVAAVGSELVKARVKGEQVGMNLSSSRISLPIQAAEQIPIPEAFSGQLSGLTTRLDRKCQAAFADLYLRKTPEEIAAIRQANRVANVGLQAFFENLRPGMAEAEVAAEVESAIHRQIGRDGIFHSRGWAMVQSGPNSADAGRFNRSTGRRLEDGDLALIELATCVNGYWSDLTRTAAVGSPKPEVERILAIATDAQQAAVDGVRSGVTAGHIDSLARDKIAAQGLSSFFTHHTGHHVGFRYHDPGFLILPGESAKLEPGMVITIEPGVYVPERGCGARIEDNVLVTESGHEVLSRFEGNELQ
ncbi:MAG TPA: Xaa-Pro peptidase family protein [Terriglobales bacterium]|nr:Xaa-Pro peptidase family protein [Terriglobales bacterium]